MYKQLTQAQRYTIFVLKQKKWTNKSIAEAINVHPSTVSRELRRNSMANGVYYHEKAEKLARSRRNRVPGNRSISPAVRMVVRELILTEDWSPKQVSGYLKRERGISISHETIYKMIREDATGELAGHCRHKMRYKKKKKRKRETKATNIRNRVSIHERPAEADGTRFGDYEMDLIVDKRGNAILVIVERSTNFLLMAKLKEGRKAMPLAKDVRRLLLPYRGENLKSITTDNGSEFAEHEWISRQLKTQVYFTDSYASWQKGCVENTNKLIRQYIPKGTDISTVSDKKIAMIQHKINKRPREKLKFSTPVREFFKFFM